MLKKVVVYVNQFFGQVGGEDKAYLEPQVNAGMTGATNLYNGLLQDAAVVATVICGDNYYAENMDQAADVILEKVKEIGPDLFIAGPAFNAGRYGIACGDICARVGRELNIPTLTGVNEENPAVDMYRDKTYILQVGKSAADMRNAVKKIAALANKLLNGEPIGLPDEEHYFAKGIRVNLFREKNGAARALDMLLAKLQGRPYKTEIPLPVYKAVSPAKPVTELRTAKLCLVTSSGLVPKGNPDHLPAATAKFYKKYDISGLTALSGRDFESVHAGFDPVYANADPNRLVPVDVVMDMVQKGVVGSLHNYLYTTTGNSTSVADATRMGQEIARELRNEGVDAVILTST